MTVVERNGFRIDVDKAREAERARRERAYARALERARASFTTRQDGARTVVRREPLKRQGRVNPVSDKRRVENRQRAAMLREMFPEPENVMCVVPGCCRRADDAHEPLSRGRGGSITDKTNVVPICRPHHDEITFRPTSELGWAYDLGLLKHSGGAV